jgi:hypothetical protein
MGSSKLGPNFKTALYPIRATPGKASCEMTHRNSKSWLNARRRAVLGRGPIRFHVPRSVSLTRRTLAVGCPTGRPAMIGKSRRYEGVWRNHAYRSPTTVLAASRGNIGIGWNRTPTEHTTIGDPAKVLVGSAL